MKKYIKPTMDIEKYEISNIIAALSENKNTSLDTSEDMENWDDFWN